MVISKKAYRSILENITYANNMYETGGILIGYKILWFYFILDVTSQEKISKKSQTSFFLNGDFHTKSAETIIKQYSLTPCVLGLWHSHICYDTEFSQQDKIANRQFATIFEREILSMIVIMYGNYIKLATYCVLPNGNQTLLSKKIRRKNYERK